MKSSEDENIVRLKADRLKRGEVPPWVIEDEIVIYPQGVSPRQFCSVPDIAESKGFRMKTEKDKK